MRMPQRSDPTPIAPSASITDSGPLLRPSQLRLPKSLLFNVEIMQGRPEIDGTLNVVGGHQTIANTGV
jgi:hypothetical protein